MTLYFPSAPAGDFSAIYCYVPVVKTFPQKWCSLLILAVCLTGCNRSRGRVLEVAYVSVPQAMLRDHVSAVFNKTGIIKNGERVEVLERERRFVRVRSDSGVEGWVEQRFLAPARVYDGFQTLVKQEKADPVQATGTTRNDTNLHLTPGRDTDHLYLLNQGSKVALLRRAAAERSFPSMQPKSAQTAKPAGAPIVVPMEDWWLIRDQQGRVGWLLARMVDLDVPLEIAQYAEGQRLIAFFVLDEVNDGEKKVPQYLVVFSEPKDGLPFDFDQIRVFTWNVRRHRYETAYREHGLSGVLPVTISHETFEKEGNLPVFILHVKDDSGNTLERKYKLNTPIVRRVLAPGEMKEPARGTLRRLHFKPAHK